MKKEVDFAVECFHRIAFGTKKHGSKFISESKLASFITILTDLLIQRFEKNWHPEHPVRGSALRCIRVNSQSVDPVVLESLKRAKISLPRDFRTTELTVWVDPGVVSVRIGEDGSIGSEIVDEEAYKMGNRPRSSSNSLKRSGSVGDDELSSRSSSPDSTSSLRSDSASPPLFYSSTPQFGVSESPVREYNPYNPPSCVSYPQRYKQSPSPTSSLSSSPQSLKNVTPNRAFNSMAAATQGRSPRSTHSSPLSFSSLGDYGQSGHSYIPSASHQRTATYTRPRAIFAAPSDDNSQLEGLNKLSYNQYSVSSFGLERNMPTGNFYDIPAMA